jgi:crossover junction endodeoxyribonuclease RusA
MKLILPWPPSMNSYWQQRVIVPKATGGRAFVQVYISERGQQFTQDVAAAVLEQLGQHQPLAGQLSLRITWFPPDRRDRDWDNPLKPLCDAMAKAGVYLNDKQIRRARIEFGPVVKGGRCEVQIATIAEAQTQRVLPAFREVVEVHQKENGQ